jgi:UDP-N-acetylmuramoyl-tripeptide--D-alanyl-D-alanine ligase
MRILSLEVLSAFGIWRSPLPCSLKLRDCSTDGIAVGVACDSRAVEPGQLFIALPGHHTDGHAYLADAAARGAVAAVVLHSYNGPGYGMALLAVDDTLVMLQQLAATLLSQQGCRVIAITGSVGKTTTKEFLITLLKDSYRVGYTPGNANSQIGLPMALINHLNGDEEIVVCEMGMSQAGELSRLIAMAPPDLALITEVALAHAAAFSDINAIARAKGEILAHPQTQAAFINGSIANYRELTSIGSCCKYAFSCGGGDADFQLQVDEKGNMAILKGDERLASFPPLHLPGRHNGFNSLLAALAAHWCGVSWGDVAARMPLLQLPERRLQYIEKKGVLFVNDAYNACLSSMVAALEAIPQPSSGGRRIAALGAMLELGEFSEQCHLQLAEEAMKKIDCLLCLGSECRPMVEMWQAAGRPCQLFDDLQTLSRALWAMINPGDVVLLKGSRAKQMWKVVEIDYACAAY